MLIGCSFNIKPSFCVYCLEFNDNKVKCLVDMEPNMSNSPAGGQQDGSQPPLLKASVGCSQSGFAVKDQLKNFQLRTGQHQNLAEPHQNMMEYTKV